MGASKLLLFIFLAVTACTPNPKKSAVILSPDASIIGGQQATATDAVTASTVSLVTVFDKSIYAFCSGTLISKNLVVTAAHCIRNGAENISIFMGEKLPKTPTEAKLLPIAGSEVHPDFEIIFDDNDNFVTTLNDLALIKLGSDIPEFAKPVPVLDNDLKLSVGDELLLAGYGLVKEIEEPKRAEGLNYVKVFTAKLIDFLIVTDQTKAMGACNGDSGGPAYLETSKGLVVIGATRGPHDRALDCRHFGEYTNLTKYKSFLVEYSKKLNAEEPLFISDLDQSSSRLRCNN